MSYCRWSSDNWKCDVYCYEDVGGGFTTHVARMRRIGEIPDLKFPEVNDEESIKKYVESHNAQMKALEKSTLAPIGLPHDGETFNDPDLESFKERLLELRAAGYNFPDYVI